MTQGGPCQRVRDAKVMIDSLDGLLDHFDGRIKPAAAARFRRLLVEQRREKRRQILEKDHAASGIIKAVTAAKKRVDRWPLERKGWKAIEGGLLQVYTQAHRAMRKAGTDDADENLHEWRKRTKDLRYQLELLNKIWPESINALAEQAHQLTNLLGEDHDLAVLRSIGKNEESMQESASDSELLFALIDERRLRLQEKARELGDKIFEESPDQFVERIRGYWKAAQSPLWSERSESWRRSSRKLNKAGFHRPSFFISPM